MEPENNNEGTSTAAEACDEVCQGQSHGGAMGDSACETTDTVKPMTFAEEGHYLRGRIKDVAREVKSYIGTATASTPASGDDSNKQNHREMIANATLSYRHLEDAAMRIGKALQADQGGKSILDKMSPKERADISNRQ